MPGLKKGGVWPSHTPKSRKLPGAWAPRADHRRPTRPELEAAWAEDGWEHSWTVCVNLKSVEKCRSGFQNQRKK